MEQWTRESIHELIEKQRSYFRTGETLDVNWRIAQLKKLKSALIANEKELAKALYTDLGRSEAEAFLCDTGATVMEINEIIHGLRRWAKPETHFSGFLCFPSITTKVYKMPYGVSLIISPFNFPILLTFGVLACAIAGGNTAVLKVSSKSPACSSVMSRLVAECFPPEYISVIEGGHDVADYCLEESVDKIFYTGSPKVGRHVLEKASRNLTPVALELGGETGNWCIVRKDADLKDAARKIAFFKAMNSGQICININQVAVAEEVADRFVEELKAAFQKQLGENPAVNEEYSHMITAEAYDKCDAEAKEYEDRIAFGGMGNRESLRYCPTIIYPVEIDENIVNHELFNPLLPIVTFEDSKVDKLLETVAKREHGLALYLFTKDMRWAKHVMTTQQYGGGCINEVCVHLMVKGVPFNGTGHSGMGAYHGVWGFREFTHPQTVLKGSNRFNLPLREHPYNDKKMKLIRMFEK